jgi:peroxiredoxin
MRAPWSGLHGNITPLLARVTCRQFNAGLQATQAQSKSKTAMMRKNLRGQSVKKMLTVGVVIIVAVVLFVVMGSKHSAPDSRFILLDGSSKNLSDWKGRVVLVNFWATSCTTCVAEMPDLVKTYEKYQNQGFHTVAVAMQYDPPAYVVNFAESRKLPFDVAIDNTGIIAQDWGPVQLTPTTFIVNKQGNIVKQFVGTPNFADLHNLIEKLLKQTV